MSFLYKKKFIPILIILAIFGIGIIIFGIYRGSSTEAIALNGLVYEGSVIGKSVEGRLIEAHTFSPAEAYASAGRSVHLLFVGGIHGGYEWNSVLLSYKFIDY
ncbi:MAG: hypothetical protein QF535_11860, partial [Anaerolineales bacterium]|nr:hypothetical protein [Anaerolineales bacterium]